MKSVFNTKEYKFIFVSDTFYCDRASWPRLIIVGTFWGLQFYWVCLHNGGDRMATGSSYGSWGWVLSVDDLQLKPYTDSRGRNGKDAWVWNPKPHLSDNLPPASHTYKTSTNKWKDHTNHHTILREYLNGNSEDISWVEFNLNTCLMWGVGKFKLA